MTKGQRNKLQWQVFQSKCSKKWEVRDLESIRNLMFSQAEGNVKAVVCQFYHCLCHCEFEQAVFSLMTRTMRTFDCRASIKTSDAKSLCFKACYLATMHYYCLTDF